MHRICQLIFHYCFNITFPIFIEFLDTEMMFLLPSSSSSRDLFFTIALRASPRPPAPCNSLINAQLHYCCCAPTRLRLSVLLHHASSSAREARSKTSRRLRQQFPSKAEALFRTKKRSLALEEEEEKQVVVALQLLLRDPPENPTKSSCY